MIVLYVNKMKIIGTFMNIKRLYFSDIKPYKNDIEIQRVAVEGLYTPGITKLGEMPKIYTVYFPAVVWKNDDRMITVEYEHHPTGYDPYLIKYAYCKENMPTLYDLNTFGIREQLSMALGVLYGYDEKDDCLRYFVDYVDDNGKNVPVKWFNIEPFRGQWKIWTEYFEKKF